MKKLLFVFLAITSMISCSKYPEDKIMGTWVTFDRYDGLKEITFSDENLKIKQYQYGEDTDNETIRNYKIVDDIIFIKDYDKDDYFDVRPYYNYSISATKLFLSGYYGMEIFTRKTEKNMTKTRNNLIGSWFIILNDKKIELLFGKNNVTIKQYGQDGNIIGENIITYELDEHYLKIENLENIIDSFYFYEGLCLYSINKDTLCLLTCVTGNGGDEIGTEPLYLEKQ
jgi:hypothetical protein